MRKTFANSKLKVEKCLKSIERSIWTVKGQDNFWNRLLFQLVTGAFYIEKLNKWWRYRNLQEQVRKSCYRLILNFSHALKQKAHKKSMSKIHNTKNFTALNQSQQSSTLYDQSIRRCEIFDVIHYGPTLPSYLQLTLAQQYCVHLYYWPHSTKTFEMLCGY